MEEGLARVTGQLGQPQDYNYTHPLDNISLHALPRALEEPMQLGKDLSDPSQIPTVFPK